MKTDNVSDNLKPTTSTSYFKILVGLVIIGIPYVIGMIYLARLVLQPDDVTWLRNIMVTALGGLQLYFGRIVGKSGLAKTEGKIATQVAQEAAKAAVINQVPEQYQAVLKELMEKSGFDLHEFDTSGLLQPGTEDDDRTSAPPDAAQILQRSAVITQEREPDFTSDFAPEEEDENVFH